MQVVPPNAPLTRLPTTIVASTDTPSFVIDSKNKSFKHQYANIYYLRLRSLRGYVEANARRRWKAVAGDPVYIPRVLDVVKGRLCYIVGTVYLEMPLKPNVLEDIARDHSIPAPPPKEKYYSPEDSIMLEDESGRIRIVGERLRSDTLVTGVIMGALGIETSTGDFEVVDICFAGLAPQPQSSLKMVGGVGTDEKKGSYPEEWVAIVSGLEVGASSPADAQMQMLAEYLSGEAGGLEDQTEASRISRLIIAGNSLSSAVAEADEVEKRHKRHGQDQASFTPHPTRNLSALLQDISRSMPIHILPGGSDPSGTILPQQPLPRAMLGGAASFGSFKTETNPTYIQLSFTPAEREEKPGTGKASSSRTSDTSSGLERKLLIHSGQPLNDMFRYLPSPPNTRLSIAECTLRWRHVAPTAPDTLWCHPYFTADPFIIGETPDVYIIGNQPEFKTKLVRSEARDGENGARCRIVLVPSFRETGIMVLVNLRTLAVKTVCCSVVGMSSDMTP